MELQYVCSKCLKTGILKCIYLAFPITNFRAVVTNTVNCCHSLASAPIYLNRERKTQSTRRTDERRMGATLYIGSIGIMR